MNIGFNWEEFYPDAVEQFSEDVPFPYGKKATITCYVDADHARDTVKNQDINSIAAITANLDKTGPCEFIIEK